MKAATHLKTVLALGVALAVPLTSVPDAVGASLDDARGVPVHAADDPAPVTGKVRVGSRPVRAKRAKGATSVPTALPDITEQHKKILRKSMDSWEKWRDIQSKRDDDPHDDMDWSQDGCSAPFDAGNDNAYSFDFRDACIRHDFGYRNAAWMDTFDKDKPTVDYNLYLDAYGHCLKLPLLTPGPVRSACKRQAEVFYYAVAEAGGNAAPLVNKKFRGGVSTRLAVIFQPTDKFYVRGRLNDTDKDGRSVLLQMATKESGKNRKAFKTVQKNDDGNGSSKRFYFDHKEDGDLSRVYMRICLDRIDSKPRKCGNEWEYDGKNSHSIRSLELVDPSVTSPTIALVNPYSRTVNFSLNATDDTEVAEMRVKSSGDVDWRPWVPFAASGQVVLPDQYGPMTVSFQVRDGAGHESAVQTSNSVTRTPDTTSPVISAASVTHDGGSSAVATFALNASDNAAVTQMRALVNGVPRSWVTFEPSGTVAIEGWGRFGVGFEVRDEAGNVSDVRFAGVVIRRADVSLGLAQVDNNGTVRSCGATEATACSDVVKRFRTTISSAYSPPADLLLKAWRRVNGSWVETSESPFMRETINGRTSITITVTAGLLDGLWRFQSQVPITDGSQFAGSAYQYMTISADTTPPTITGANVAHGNETSQYVQFTLSANDNVGVNAMRVIVNGAPRDWVPFVGSGTVVLPDGYGNFGIGFQVRDAAGNVSAVAFAGTVTRRSAVSLTLVQVDNGGNVRTGCGSSEGDPCSDIVKKFRTTISSAYSPPADLLLKAWRKVNGSWVETSTSPFMRETINGRTSITMTVTANLLTGIWRFQSQVPVTDATQFGSSGYQYLLID